MLTFLRHFRWLNHSDKIHFLGLALLVPIIKIFLHVFGFKKVAVFFKHTARTRAKNTADLGKVKRYDDLLNFFYRFYPVKAMCLPVSLAFWWLLKRDGIETDLHFGMRKDDDKNFRAHAWIEHLGVPLRADAGVREKYAVFNESILTRFD